eukprot:3621785-Pyramimonas_sp.AAC.1
MVVSTVGKAQRPGLLCQARPLVVTQTPQQRGDRSFSRALALRDQDVSAATGSDTLSLTS